MTDQQLAAAVNRRSNEDRATSAAQHEKTHTAIDHQTRVIKLLIDLLRVRAPGFTNPPHTLAARTIRDASEEYSAISKELIRTAKEFLAATEELSRQLRAERTERGDRTWSRATIAILALPLALGIIIQQQFSPFAMPDPTLGWKDRVWDRTGTDIAQCMTLEITDGGECVIEATWQAKTYSIPDTLPLDPFPYQTSQ